MTTASSLTQKLLPYALHPGLGSQSLRALVGLPEFGDRSANDLALQLPLVRTGPSPIGAMRTIRNPPVACLDPDYPRFCPNPPMTRAAVD